jgi:hypothetical protein
MRFQIQPTAPHIVNVTVSRQSLGFRRRVNIKHGISIPSQASGQRKLADQRSIQRSAISSQQSAKKPAAIALGKAER